MAKIGKKLAAVLLAAAMIVTFIPALGAQGVYADDTVISQIDLQYDANIIDLNTAWTEGEVYQRLRLDGAVSTTSDQYGIRGLYLMWLPDYSSTGYYGIGDGTSQVDTGKQYGISYELRLMDGFDWITDVKAFERQTDITECPALTVNVNGAERTDVKISYNSYWGYLTVYVPIETASTVPRVTDIRIDGNDISLERGGSHTFTAEVSGTVSDKSVIWSVEGANSASTMITSAGVLTVGDDEAAEEITVKATAAADSTKTAAKTVTVLGELPTIDSVTISPKTAVVYQKGSLQFTAEVLGTQTDKSVSWSLSGTDNAGTTISDSGLLTVADNEEAASITVTVTANQDVTKSDSAVVTIRPLERIATIDLAYDSGRIDLNVNDTEGEVEQRCRLDGAVTAVSDQYDVFNVFLMWLPDYSTTGYYGIGDGTSQVNAEKQYGIDYTLRLADGCDWITDVKAFERQTDITECPVLTVKVNGAVRTDVKIQYNSGWGNLDVYVPLEAATGNKPAAPTITDTSNVSGGTKVTWSAVDGADYYVLNWFDETNGTGGIVAHDITGTSYTVPKSMLTSGVKYAYTVNAIKDGNVSAQSNKKAQTYMEAPVVTKTRNVNAGIEVTWDAVGGADSYIVMYKKDGSSWSTLESGITATKYVAPKAKLASGTKYWFTVKAKGAATSGYTGGKAQTYMTTPAVTKTRNVNAGIEVTWDKVTGATSYILMYKTDGGSWSTYKSGITATKFVVPKADLKSGTKYWFTVKAKGAATSGYSSGKAQTYMTTPTVKSAVQVSGGVKVTWGAVTGAKTYTVMMKVSGGSWTTVKSGVTGTSYTVPKSKLTSGKTYSFTVKAVGAATSGYSSGKSLTYKA